MATGRERVVAALKLDIADRPPVSAWGHTFDKEWEVATLADSTIEIARRYEFDFVKLQIRATCFAEAFGARWTYSGSPAAEPVLRHPGGAVLADWRRIAGGEVDTGPLREQVEVLRQVASGLGPEIPVLQTVFSPGMVAWFLSGRDLGLLQRLVSEEPDLMAAGLARVAEVLAQFTADSLAAGAAGVFYAINPLADSRVMSTEAYTRTYIASDRVATAPAEGGWFNMLHLCGSHINRELLELVPMQCVNWATQDDGNPSLGEIAKGVQVAVAGGLGRNDAIKFFDPDEILKVAAGALAQTGGRGHLLTPGCSVSPWSQARPANLEALVRAART